MSAYRIETILSEDGKLMLSNLPFRAGERVEVVIGPSNPSAQPSSAYPLRGMILQYDQPTEPVAEEDWEAAH